ncbi:sugar ABC transporter ATP-binding protein [Tellurirhabdus rosea]|uniref:sugar ABC transporter ATP-binding protein n=1 Tax=Tellurirhabdus rosea TaxID=2674997 RepID=UPI00224CEB5D|nr:sugar ABC transporter ATP-binding protein [Tellurirhabdus rosea]
MLEIRHITKTFPGVKALDDVSLAFCRGEIHAICGENGAGKSTLMHLIAGTMQPDDGEMLLDGQPVQMRSPEQARALGIALVHQHRSLFGNLSVAENLFPDNQPRTRWGRIDFPELHRRAASLLQSLKLQRLPTHRLVAELSAGQQQMVEIARALAASPRILILDEPTASISEKDTDVLFDLIDDLRQQGKLILYISHRMKEIGRIADRVTVLKDGRHQGTFDARRTTVDALISRMVGRQLQEQSFVSNRQADTLLTVQQLSGHGFSDVSFSVQKGEIFGLAGLVGAGRTELARAIFGADPSSGAVFLEQQSVKLTHPAEAVAQGVAYLPEDRKAWALFPEKSVAENMVVSDLEAVSESGRLSRGRILGVAARFIRQLNIKTPSVSQPVGLLSGGNQQKVILARWLHSHPRLLIADEPTHGVDVGAKAEIYELLRKLAAQGVGIVLISSELPELLLLCDRVGVMRTGQLAGVLERPDCTEERIMELAT